jgi:hypothetical protein
LSGNRPGKEGDMKERLAVCLILMLVAAAGLNSCGGGGGGGVIISSTPDGTFVKNPSSVNDSFHAALFSHTHPEEHFQILYKAADMEASGYIEKLSFRYYNDVVKTACPDVIMSMGHVALNDLTYSFSSNYEDGHGSLRTVIANTTIDIPAGNAGDYFEIPLDTPFHYNGKDNLVIDITRGSVCDNPVILLLEGVAYGGIAYAQSISTDTVISNNAYTFNIKFHYRGGVDHIGDVSTIGSTPFNSADSKIQVLYPADLVNGSGAVTGLGIMFLNTGASDSLFTYSVKMGHTTLTTLGATYADNYDSGAPVTVASNAVVNVPEGITSGDTLWLPIPDRVFRYNGTDNLLIEVDVTARVGGLYTSTVSSAENRMVFSASGFDTGIPYPGYKAMALRFKGGTMDVMPTVSAAQSFPFNASEGKVQHLYYATDLGTKGTINSFQCRAAYDASTVTDFSYTVTLAHSTAMDLTTVYDDNLASDAKVVFNGTFGLPDVLEGDWIEIPFTSGFDYNGKDNLVVEIKGTSGLSTLFHCQRNSGGLSYSTGLSGGGDQNAASGAQMPARLVTRFVMK